jgi:GH25 family lysozyme M1 (1,4-beta-N-acetylmuramidase)
MRAGTIVKAIPVACLLLTAMAHSQEQSKEQLNGPPDLATLRRLRAIEANEKVSAPFASRETPAPAWVLNTNYRSGTYGIDLSHWETKPCTFDSAHLQRLPSYGLRFVYLETTRGTKVYTSVGKVWTLLAPLHASKTLFRGAYHFLMPLNPDGTGDAASQANAFLKSVGAGGSDKLAALAPVLDIESTHTPITQGTDAYNNCKRREQDSDTKAYYCDRWSEMTKQKIVALAQAWIAAVEPVTKQKVTLYTNDGWWNDDNIMGTSGMPLSSGRPIWIANYPTSGMPQYDNAANLPPLPNNVTYPNPYNKPSFWQFTQSGSLSSDPFSCSSDDPQGSLDFSYVPLPEAQFEAVFGVQ